MPGYLITIGASAALPAEQERRCHYRYRKADAVGILEVTRLGTSTKGLLVLSPDGLACEVFVRKRPAGCGLFETLGFRLGRPSASESTQAVSQSMGRRLFIPNPLARL